MKKGVSAPPAAGARRPARRPRPLILRRTVTRREAAEAADRLRTSPEGNRYVIRFTPGQRTEHTVLIFSFTGLAVTGLAQTFYTNPLASFVLSVLGGIDNDRAMHHLMAFVFIILAIYHVGLFVNQRFVNLRTSKMFPEWSDFLHLTQMVKFNLGLSQRFPRFDRFNFEEKAEYWALIWGGVVMGITGLMQWFPIVVTDVLPGWAIPVARAFHRWEAILAVLAILTWHSYHTVIKKLNLSIFTGNLSLEEMEEEHPVELAYLEKAAAALGSKTWPVIVEIPLEAPPPVAAPVPVSAPAVADTAEEIASAAVVEAAQPATQAEDPSPEAATDLDDESPGSKDPLETTS